MSTMQEIRVRFIDERIRFGDVLVGEAELLDDHSDVDVDGAFGIKGAAEIDELQPNMCYRLWGRWGTYTNKRTGREETQFQFATFVEDMPFGRDGVVSYLLMTGKGHGIGPARAQKIWDLWGPDAIRRLREEPQALLTEIPGLDPTALDAMSQLLRDKQAIEGVTVELVDLLTGRGFPRTTAQKAIKKWGNVAAAKIRRIPYLLMAFRGCGFRRCDALWLDLGRPPDRLLRQALCAWYTVASDSNGHTWYRVDFAKAGIRRQVGGTGLRLEAAIELALRIGKLSVDRFGALAMLQTNGAGTAILPVGNQWVAEGRKAWCENRLADLVVKAVRESTSKRLLIYDVQKVREEHVPEYARCTRCRRKLTAERVAVLDGDPYGPDCISQVDYFDNHTSVPLVDWLQDHATVIETTQVIPEGYQEFKFSSLWPDPATLAVSDHQRDELRKAFAGGPIAILGGSPGTGKTYCASQVIAKLVQTVGLGQIAAAAPTGKAAVRLTELLHAAGIQLTARTWHSLLGRAVNTSKTHDDAADDGSWAFAHDESKPLPFKVVIGDECFPAGTLVDTPFGKKPIETLQPGCTILNAYGIDVIVAVRRKELTRAVKIIAGKTTVVASESHPIFTQRGIVVAAELEPGDSILQTAEAMRLLRQANLSQERSGGTEAFLQHILLNEMVDEFSRSEGKDPHGRRIEEGWGRSQAISMVGISGSRTSTTTVWRNQANAKARIAGEGVPYSESDGAQAVNSGWERPSHTRAAATTAGGTRPRLDRRVSDRNEESNERMANLLQDRHCESAAEGCDRSRWSQPPYHQGQRARRPERHASGFTRVDRIEILESGSPELDRFRDEHGKLYFYDIQAARHQSFSIEGLLVHNCSMCDTNLMSAIFRARAPGTHLLLIGDINQLPPVGHGAPLRDLIAARVPYGELRDIWRNSGGIVEACAAIRDGRPWVAGDNLRVLEPRTADPSEQIQLMLRALHRSAEMGLDPVWDCQVICAVNAKSELSRYDLNRALQLEFNKSSSKYECAFREGDKIVCTKNGDYMSISYDPNDPNIQTNDKGEVRCANGELAKVLEVQEKLVIAELTAPSRIVKIPYGKPTKKAEGEDEDSEEDKTSTGCKWDLGYCLSVHKCVHPNTLVETPAGLMPIRRLSPTGRIGTPCGVHEYTERFYYEHAPCLAITTKDGQEITVTVDHRCERWNGTAYELVEAGALRIGDFVRTALFPAAEPTTNAILPPGPVADCRAKDVSVPTVMTPELAEFLGLCVADGVIFHGGVRLGKRHAEVAQRFTQLCAELFGTTNREFPTSGMLVSECCSSVVRDWLYAVGGCYPKATFVPECILESTLPIHRAFLRGLFEDGTVNLAGQQVDHIEWSTCFPRLLVEVRAMLARLGFISGRNSQKTGRGLLYLYGQEAVRFGREIGFLSQFKQQRLQLPAGEQTRYVVPVSRDFIDHHRQFFGKWSRQNARSRGYLSRRDLQHAAERGCAEATELLRWHHSRIGSINATSGPVMCVEVPGCGRFMQNGFPWGNSQGSEWPIVITMIDEYPGARRVCSREWLYTAISRGKQFSLLVGRKATADQYCRKIALSERKTLLRELILSKSAALDAQYL